MYQSEVVKVRKNLVNASISGFYQTISVNAGICRQLLAKVRFVWLWLLFNYFCLFKDCVNGIENENNILLSD